MSDRIIKSKNRIHNIQNSTCKRGVIVEEQLHRKADAVNVNDEFNEASWPPMAMLGGTESMTYDICWTRENSVSWSYGGLSTDSP